MVVALHEVKARTGKRNEATNPRIDLGAETSQEICKHNILDPEYGRGGLVNMEDNMKETRSST